MGQPESPKYTPVITHAYSTKEPFTDPKSVFYSNIKEPATLLGTKRTNSVTVKNLEKQLASENFIGYHTPVHHSLLNHKRSKIDFNSSSEKKEFNLDKQIQ